MCFFSSRRRHTRLQGDWSSDVCSSDLHDHLEGAAPLEPSEQLAREVQRLRRDFGGDEGHRLRSEEHTSELQSPCNLVCRLLLEKKKRTIITTYLTVVLISSSLSDLLV